MRGPRGWSLQTEESHNNGNRIRSTVFSRIRYQTFKFLLRVESTPTKAGRVFRQIECDGLFYRQILQPTSKHRGSPLLFPQGRRVNTVWAPPGAAGKHGVGIPSINHGGDTRLPVRCLGVRSPCGNLRLAFASCPLTPKRPWCRCRKQAGGTIPCYT